MINKKAFFKWCRQSAKGPDAPLLRVTVGPAYSSDLERSVWLDGSWHNSTQVRVRLYTPQPGRQGEDCYRKANAACERERVKYQRWLDEFQQKVKAQP